MVWICLWTVFGFTSSSNLRNLDTNLFTSINDFKLYIDTRIKHIQLQFDDNGPHEYCKLILYTMNQTQSNFQWTDLPKNHPKMTFWYLPKQVYNFRTWLFMNVCCACCVIFVFYKKLGILNIEICIRKGRRIAWEKRLNNCRLLHTVTRNIS